MLAHVLNRYIRFGLIAAFFAIRREARAAIVEDLEAFHNCARLDSSQGSFPRQGLSEQACRPRLTISLGFVARCPDRTPANSVPPVCPSLCSSRSSALCRSAG